MYPSRRIIIEIGMLLAALSWGASASESQPAERGAAAIQQAVRDIPTRKGVTQRLLLLKPPRPVAVLLVFADTERPLGISNDGRLSWGRHQLLIRTSPLFSSRHFIVAIADAPSDQFATPSENFRESANHMADMDATTTFLRKEYGLPVWLIGAGTGTLSLLSAAAQPKQTRVDGIVLATGMPENPGSRLRNQLGEVRIPVLSVRKTDSCTPSPLRDGHRDLDLLVNAPRKEEIFLKPPATADADPCKAAPAHGYLGLEDQFVDKVTQWIKTTLGQDAFI